jgi:hypothetical protein
VRAPVEVDPLAGFGCADVEVEDVPVCVVLEERWTRRRATNAQPIPTRSNLLREVTRGPRSSSNPDENADGQHA